MNKVKTRFCDTVEGRECCRGAGGVGRGEAAALSGGWGPRHCLGLPPTHCAASGVGCGEAAVLMGGWGLRHCLGLPPAPPLCHLSKCLGPTGASCLWHTVLSAWSSFPAMSWPCDRLCIPWEPTQYSAGASPSPGCSLTTSLAFSVGSYSAIVFQCLFGSHSTLFTSIFACSVLKRTAGWPPHRVDSHPQPPCPLVSTRRFVVSASAWDPVAKVLI